MIYCIGDSFTAGDELPDWEFREESLTYCTSDFAWPALLGTKLNHPVTNLGRGGSGNTRIIKRAMDLCISKQDNTDVIIVAWTNPQRQELADDFGIWDVWAERNTEVLRRPQRATIIKWLAVHQNAKEIELYYYSGWLRQIILLQKFFESNNQRYIMLQTHVTEYWNWQFKTLFQNLKSQIDTKYFLGWPEESMMNWTVNCPRGVSGHFLEQGHEIVAQKVFEHIRSLGWFS